MRIEVQMFAAAREAAGCDRISLDVVEGALAKDVIAAIGERLPEIAALLPSCRLAVDCSFVGGDAKVETSSEIALIPPVSGG